MNIAVTYPFAVCFSSDSKISDQTLDVISRRHVSVDLVIEITFSRIFQQVQKVIISESYQVNEYA